MRTEFEFIHNIKNKYGLKHIGDDCAVLPKDAETDMVITADMLVEDIDFRLDWTIPELLGQKALAVSLSDVAAMGAKPEWAILSIGITETVWNSDWIDKFYEGWFKLARHHGVELVGGDISRSPDKIVIDSTVAGTVHKREAILRSGANPGDAIFVTGTLGGAAGGLMLLESGIRYKDADDRRKELIKRQIRPVPQVEAGQFLSANRLASSMIDISDGLSSDIHHLCESGDVGARLESNAIPVDPNLIALAVSEDFLLWQAINGGEDFELLFTVPEENISQAEAAGFKRIGVVTANIGTVEVIKDGRVTGWLPRGYRHF